MTYTIRMGRWCVGWSTRTTRVEIGQRICGLTWDSYVRKNGSQRGLTFGVVAGCYAGIKHEESGWTEPCEEFYVVKEKILESGHFSTKEDSGSVIITNEAKAVGIAYAGYELT